MTHDAWVVVRQTQAQAAAPQSEFFIGRIFVQAGIWGLFVGLILVAVVSSTKAGARKPPGKLADKQKQSMHKSNSLSNSNRGMGVKHVTL